MLSPTSSAGAAALAQSNSATPSTTTIAARTRDDFENFLQLLTAQLRNQDPLSPLDSTQFVAQLASFSTVEQLVNANKQLDAIAASTNGNSLDRYAAWIGREAEIVNAPAIYEGVPVDFRIQQNPNADRIEMVVRDSAGNEVSRFLGANADDMQSWNGQTPNGTAVPGVYQISAEYYSNGKLLTTKPTSVFLPVEEVRTTPNGLNIGLAGGVYRTPDEIVGLRLDQ